MTADIGNVTCLAFHDLSVAFDTVDYTILLVYMSAITYIAGRALGWFASSLRDTIYPVPWCHGIIYFSAVWGTAESKSILDKTRIDFCNSVYTELPQSQSGRLQVIVNMDARVITGIRRFSHIKDFIRDRLHWLLVRSSANSMQNLRTRLLFLACLFLHHLIYVH